MYMMTIIDVLNTVLSFEGIHVETQENMTKEILILIYSDKVINKV